MPSPAMPTSHSGPPQTTDIYRPLAKAIQKPIAHLLPTSIAGPSNLPPTAASLFDLDPRSFASRLQNKAILLDGHAAAISQPSVLITGKKLNRGYPEIRKRVREETEQIRDERKAAGVNGMRKVRKKLDARVEGGAVLQAGMKISYTSMIPLNHLHLTYLTHLLSLPPLPSPIPHVDIDPSSSSSLPPGLSAEGFQSRLCKADLTGLSISVSSARNSSLTGLSGIIIEETSSTFRLISPDDTLRVIPKSGTLFEILLPAYAPRNFHSAGDLYGGGSNGQGDGERPDPIDWEKHLAVCPRMNILLLGTSFGFRSGDRAGRKFRPAQGGGGGSGWGEEWVKGEWKGVLDAVERDIEVRKGQGKGMTAEEKAGQHIGNGIGKKRKRGKARRKDPPAWGRLEVP